MGKLLALTLSATILTTNPLFAMDQESEGFLACKKYFADARKNFAEEEFDNLFMQGDNLFAIYGNFSMYGSLFMQGDSPMEERVAVRAHARQERDKKTRLSHEAAPQTLLNRIPRKLLSQIQKYDKKPLPSADTMNCLAKSCNLQQMLEVEKLYGTPNYIGQQNGFAVFFKNKWNGKQFFETQPLEKFDSFTNGFFSGFLGNAAPVFRYSTGKTSVDFIMLPLHENGMSTLVNAFCSEEPDHVGVYLAKKNEAPVNTSPSSQEDPFLLCISKIWSLLTPEAPSFSRKKSIRTLMDQYIERLKANKPKLKNIDTLLNLIPSELFSTIQKYDVRPFPSAEQLTSLAESCNLQQMEKRYGIPYYIGSQEGFAFFFAGNWCKEVFLRTKTVAPLESCTIGYSQGFLGNTIPILTYGEHLNTINFIMLPLHEGGTLINTLHSMEPDHVEIRFVKQDGEICEEPNYTPPSSEAHPSFLCTSKIWSLMAHQQQMEAPEQR
jgi:hypothetical protein